MRCLPTLPTDYYVENGRLADAILALSDRYRQLAPQEILARIHGLASRYDQYWQREPTFARAAIELLGKPGIDSHDKLELIVEMAKMTALVRTLLL